MKDEMSYLQWGWSLITGPTPVPAEERMKEIMTRMGKLQTKLEIECDIKADDMKRMQRDIKKAADKSNEMEVRNLAKQFISLQKQHKSAVARLDKVTARTTSMHDLHVGGVVDKDMVEFVQCHNDLTAAVSNPRNVQMTMGRFSMQQQSLKLCEEMINDALEESEENEEEEEVNQAVEDLVGLVMNQASCAVLNQLPTIKNTLNQHTINKDPRVANERIQEFFNKK